MINLSVNINKIATLRNSRGGDIPNLIKHAKIILDSGAQGITIHPRSDERHITKRDVKDLKSFIQDYNQNSPKKIEFNIEGELSDRFLSIVLEAKPNQATLVPVLPGEITSDHGFDLYKEKDILKKYIEILKKEDIRTSIFVETDLKNLELLPEVHPDRVEFYTGPFAENFLINHESAFRPYFDAANLVLSFGIGINAGHDLDQYNLRVFRNLPGLQEVSIGHRLVSYALEVGMERAVKDYLKILE